MNNFRWIVAALIFLYIIIITYYLMNHDFTSKPQPTYVTIQGDTNMYRTTIVNPSPTIIDNSDTAWKYIPIDTQAILEAFYARLVYEAKLKYCDDSSVYIDLKQYVSKNRLDSFRLEVQNKRETTINTFVTNDKEFFGTALLTLDTARTHLYLGGTYRKGKMEYTLAKDLFSKSGVLIGVNYKFKLKKK